MQSITGNATQKEKVTRILKLVSNRVVNAHREPIKAEPQRSDVERGLDVLLDLVGHVRLPVSQDQEFHALRALQHLYSDMPLSADALEKKEEICRHVELVKKEEAVALFEWIDPESSGISGIAPKFFRTRERHLLLFVLLAKVVAPVTKFDIVPILHDQGYLGNGRDRYALLSWVPRICFSSKTVRLAMAYIELARMVLFFDEETRPADMDTIADIKQWNWRRQIIRLQIWRSIWDLERDRRFDKSTPNPIHHAHSVEFELANRGFFKRLRLRGGPVTFVALKKLSYYDRKKPSRKPALRDFAVLAVLVAATIATVMAFSKRVQNWNQENREFATLVNEMFLIQEPPADVGADEGDVATGTDESRQAIEKPNSEKREN